MKHLLPFSTDYTLIEDREGIPFVIIWGNEGEGFGRVAMVYGEVDGESEQLCKDMAEFLVTASNAHYPMLEALETFVRCHRSKGFVQVDEDVIDGAKAAIAQAKPTN